MHRHLVVIEKVDGDYSAYSPDLPGCVATGATREEAEGRMHEAIAFHLDGLREDGLPLPDPQAFAAFIAVSAARPPGSPPCSFPLFSEPVRYRAFPSRLRFAGLPLIDIVSLAPLMHRGRGPVQPPSRRRRSRPRRCICRNG